MSDRPIRICQLITELVPAGAERVVCELATRLDKSRFNVQVAALRGGLVARRLEEAGVKVTVLGVRHKLDVGKVFTLAKTQLGAMQTAFLVMFPSVLLSGFMFPRSEMPLPIYVLTFGIPATYFLEILRGIVLRGADFKDLLPHVAALATCTAVILGLSLGRFHKQLE